MAPGTRDVLILLLIVCGWAFNVIAMKFGLMELPPLFMLALRFLLVALLLVPFHPVTRQQLPWLVLLAFTFGFIHFGLMVLGMRSTDAGSTAVLIQMGTPFAMILAAVWLKETLTLRRIFGVLLALSGVIVLAGSPSLASWRSVFLLLISASGWSVTTMLVKLAPPIKPMAMTGWLSLFALPMVALASALLETNQLPLLLAAGWRGWLGVIYSVLGSSLLAYSLWYGLLKRYPASQLLPWSLLSPALAMMMGVWVFSERLDHAKLGGAALIVGGILFAILPQRALRIRLSDKQRV
ncbi:DMT family transporter [Klebsiella indica]|uniref:DMT family transporter n=1 Tax=Klebsiella indica TaxID=2582917 RepID=A0A5R9LFV8_9ENTR|nr:DMT family transporter [Klebsiella indica]TLV15626.1 DMT family transporter [Klebsiella indica]